MRDLVVREAVKTMAEEAARCLQALVAAGEEVPYDVREPGEGGALPQYVPLAHRFIREHADALRGLDSFGAACAALEASGCAASFLERLGLRPPAEPRRQAELACVAFLCRLWAESSDFSLGEGRLAVAIEELERGSDAGEDEIEVVVPLRGLQMPVRRLELATATIVQADTVDVPAEARRPEGAGVAGWEVPFLAVTRVSELGAGDGAADAGARAVEAFRLLITTLRLFKAGGVGLGAHAWARSGGDRWRRIVTGCARPRAGGYRLTEAEIDDLIAFSLALAERFSPFGASAARRAGLAAVLGRAISRFEAGLERNAVLEALNDYLLAARFLLEGGGPAGLGLSIRIAALCAEPAERADTKAIVDRALALERELWAGEPVGERTGATAADTALAVEELVRAILKDAACGHLGSDLRATADEILLADGLAVGEGSGGQRGATAEWAPADAPDEAPAGEPTDAAPAPEDSDAPAASAALDEPIGFDVLAASDEDDGADLEWGDPAAAPLEDDLGDRGPGLQVPEPEGRISVERRAEPTEEENVNAEPAPLDEQPTELMPALEERRRRGRSRARELLAGRPAERQRTAARVAYLFPRPETTEWSVREIAYDRTRRARIRGT